MNIYNSKGKIKKVTLRAYYNLDGEYLLFDSNPLHNKSYENVNVEIKTITKTICNIDLDVDVINIEGQKSIECELVGYNESNGELLIKICQDWG